MRSLTQHALPLLALLVTVASAQAGDCCCSHCGGCSCCEKVCRLVCEDKKVEVICWGYVCEDFCLPGPGEPCCKQCKTVCVDCEAPCDPKTPCVEPKYFVWREWIPSCAKLFTRRKLMKKTETVSVPSYKWVVEDMCPHCQSCCDVAEVDATTQAELPAPPLAEAKLLYRLK
jgi:hypothetical protein